MTAGTSPRLVSVHIYPLKSVRGIDLTDAQVEPWGLAGDRRWLLIEMDGKFVTQRQEPSMARVVVRYIPGGSGAIEVSADGGPPLAIPAPDPEQGAEMVWVNVWTSKILAAAAGKAADELFSRFLGRPLRLVYLDDPTRRQVDPEFGHPDDRVSFADGFPLLLTAVSSLEALNDWLIEDRSEPVPMNRFRPSAVVAGTPAWAEDGWHRVRLGPVTFRVAKPCGRCQITTTDQFTGERGREPLMMLGRRRQFGQQLVFGQNLIPDGTGTIRVGDEVEILE
jgi:uncharacterized protein